MHPSEAAFFNARVQPPAIIAGQINVFSVHGSEMRQPRWIDHPAGLAELGNGLLKIDRVPECNGHDDQV